MASTDAGSAASVAASAPPPAAGTKPARFDLLAHLPACEIRHRGWLLDLGTRAGGIHRSFRVEPIEDSKDAERDGATVARILTKSVTFELRLDEAIEEPVLSVRARGITAKTMAAAVDDRKLAAHKLALDETRVVELPLSKEPLAPGRHTVELRFGGRPRGASEPLAEIDWIRLATAEETAGPYAAPTLRDLVADAALDGVPRRAIALRAPASVRCPFVLSPDARWVADLGFWGSGRGVAEIRVLADGADPVVLTQRKVSGGDGATWTPLDLPLTDHASHPVVLELRALESTKGGRILFGDPALMRRPAAPTGVPEASTVVLIVASALDRRSIPPWGATQGLATLGELARTSAVFAGYRVPSTVPAAVLASLLTGMSPGAHGLEDPAARLPASVRTLPKLVKEASGRTAMFTGVPTSFAAFGFDAGWDQYQAFSPVQDVDATEPIRRATKWLEREIDESDGGRRLVVVHARGAHPPWDLTKEAAAALGPEEYGGQLEPRRGGVVIAKLRSARRGPRRLADQDWMRLRALTAAALLEQDAALGQLVAVLKKSGAWESTLLVLVGDVAPGAAPDLPFDPAGSLTEERLLVPLLVKFPGGQLAAKEVTAQVTSVDVAATALAALGIKRSAPAEGLDLFQIAQGQAPLEGRALVSTLGDRYTTRLGVWLLSGQLGKVPTLCQLDVDPACVTDVFGTKAVAGWAAWQATYDAFSAAHERRLVPREPASIDPDLGAALTVWGDIGG